MEMRGDDALLLPGLQYHGPRAAAKQHGRGAVLPVE